MKKVFIFGYYGFKNIGDEAILQSIVKLLKDSGEDVDIRALSYNVKHTKKYHNIDGVSRNSLKDILNSIRKADLVVSGGGTLLQDKTSSRSLYYYLGLIMVSKFLGKKVMFFCNGFGPIKNKINRIMTKVIIKHVDYMLIRDKLSAEKLLNLGIKEDKILPTTDATLILDEVRDDVVDRIIEEEKIPKDKKLIGISVRPWNLDDRFYSEIAGFCDYVYDRGYYPVFIPMQQEKDQNVSFKVTERMNRDAVILQGEYTPSELLGIIKRLDLLVGMRLHALIFACSMNTPVIGIEYDPKIKGFLDMVNQTNIGDVKTIEKINLCLAFDELILNYDEIKQKLTFDMDNIREEAEINGIELIKML